jgi:hypothetical protein
MKFIVVFLAVQFSFKTCKCQIFTSNRDSLISFVLADTVFPDDISLIAGKVRSPSSDAVKIFSVQNSFFYHDCTTKLGWDWQRYVNEMTNWLRHDKPLNINGKDFIDYNSLPSSKYCMHFANYSTNKLINLLHNSSGNDCHCIVDELFKRNILLGYNETKYSVSRPLKQIRQFQQ